MEQVATGEEVVISKAGEPVAKVVPLRPKVRRTGRGSLRGRIHIPDDFDALPDDIADAFGMRRCACCSTPMWSCGGWTTPRSWATTSRSCWTRSRPST
ncbi:type II toxin-antitoxin system prevent-host-death family antitoxin [Streptomyces sp. NBC_01304]|nr:type II toxin-antitoxin system prevent-host-death family antitoxin [Streptomyces sp. NBC_01304]